jgi:hypothetical protein
MFEIAMDKSEKPKQPIATYQPTDPDAAAEVPTHGLHFEPHGNVQTDDVNVGLVASLGGIAAVLLVVIIAGLQAWFYNWQADEQAAKITADPGLASLVGSQKNLLSGTAPGSMPIDQAMTQIVDRYKQPQ